MENNKPQNDQQPVGDAHDDGAGPDTTFDPAEFPGANAELRDGKLPADGAESPDPFDLTKWRLVHDYGASLGVKKALLSVPIRKPDKSWFVRVHPNEAYRQQTAVIELKEERGSETYLVAPRLWPELAG